MTKPAKFTQADIRRAIAPALALGQPVASYRVHPDGYIEVLLGKPKPGHDNDEWADLE